MSKIQKALRVTSRRRKYADGGDTSDLSPNDQAAMMPETYVNPLAKHLTAGAVSRPYGMIKDMVDGAREDAQDWGENGMSNGVSPKTIRGSGELVVQGLGNSIGVRPVPGGSTAGVFVGPYGATALRNAAKETGNAAAEKALVHPVVGKEIEKEVQSMPEWMRDPYRSTVQEERDRWAHSVLEARAAKGDFRDRDVFARSGWSFTADGKPAKEISDIGASVKPVKGAPGKFALDHPAGDLHKTYDMPPITQGGGPKDSVAYFRTEPLTIGTEGNPAKNTSAILHEMQHGISLREGWPRGGNPGRIPQEVSNRELFPGRPIPEYQKEIFMAADPRITREKFGGLSSDSNTARLAGYLHSAGENQAFNVQNRRRNSFKYLMHPQDTEISPRAFQYMEYNAPRKAGGGGVGNFNPERASAFGLAHQGAIKSSVPGRTDKLNLDVASGSSVVPADVVSGLGQGNSDAGHAILSKMFTSGPYGMNLPKAKAGSRVGPRKSSLSKMSFTKSGYADGGETGNTPIVAAGGEHVITPDQVMAVGGGDLDLGHKFLNRWYENTRAKTIQQMKSLKPPKNG